MSKSPSLRRIQADIRELALDPSEQYFAAPLENDMFEWHFTIRGAVGTDFEGGIYHGRILLPAEYPYKPPHIVFLTPSGRFETNTKVCLSFSAYHPELWQPAWGIRLILEALISFLPTPGDGAIGALDYKPEERKRLAKLSQTWCCPTCGPIAKLLPKFDPEKKKCSTAGTGSSFAKQIAELQRLQQQAEGGKRTKNAAKEKSDDDETTTTTETLAAVGVPSPEGRTEEHKASVIDGDASTSHDKKSNRIAPSEKSDNATENSITNGISDKAMDAEAKQQTQAQQEPESDSEVETHESPTIQNDATETNNTEVLTDAATDNFTKLYDPLMNVSILLMICICILLWKKGVDLYQELQQLKAMPLVEKGLAASKAAATSSVAAATSDEL
mmetsp:Transcript_7947/g.19744  ORF Transcript_7947/g.19744 Transcript_7947/m.19744 type:complete len:387 (-) Transcript_7947:325-1485(-)